jgi:hypothetical protein
MLTGSDFAANADVILDVIINGSVRSQRRELNVSGRFREVSLNGTLRDNMSILRHTSRQFYPICIWRRSRNSLGERILAAEFGIASGLPITMRATLRNGQLLKRPYASQIVSGTSENVH